MPEESRVENPKVLRTNASNSKLGEIYIVEE